MDVAAYILAIVGAIFLAFAGLHGFENKSVTIVSFGAGAILLVIAGCLYWQDAIWKREAAKPERKGRERPYVVIQDSMLEPLEPGKPQTLSFVLDNISSVEVSGYFEPMTCFFSDFTNTQRLEYNGTGKRLTFRLAPTEKNTIQCKVDIPLLDTYQIKMLNDHTAELFFFTKGAYSTEGGDKFPLFYCRRYDVAFPTRLVFCDEGITFKEPKEGD